MKTRLLMCSAVALSGQSLVQAQETDGDAEGVRRLQSVVVEAQRREQDLLDVPLAVQAFDESALEASGIDDVIDLNLASPSFFLNTLQERTGNTPVRIRGIGTVGSNPGFEGAVGVYIDDVYRSRAGMALATFTDIGGLEVLRGPQGTLFGKNTTAGALVIRSNAPILEEFGAEIGATFGNFDAQRYEANINVPLGERVAIRASALLDEGDGFFSDPVTGDNHQPVDQQSYRLQVAFEPTDRISGRLVFDHTEAEGPFGYGRSTRFDSTDEAGILGGLFGPAALNLLPGAPAGGAGYWYWDITTPDAQADPFSYDVALNRQNENNVEDKGIALTLDFELTDNLSLRSITSRREFSDDNVGADWDFGPVDVAGELSLRYDFETFSQEFLLSGEQDFESGSSLDYVVGLNYFNEEFDYDRTASVGSQFASIYSLLLAGQGVNFAEFGACPEFNPALGCFSVTQVGTANLNFQDSFFTSEEESLGVFAHGTYNFNDQWSVVGGVRFNSVEKSGTHTNNAAASPIEYFGLVTANALAFALNGAALSGSDFDVTHEDEEITYNAALQYRPTSDMQLYASYSRGFKAGGVNLNNDAPGGAPSLTTGVPTEVAPGVFLPLTVATPENVTYAPEFVDAYELGFRWEYGGAGRLSVTAFRSEYEDLQVSVYTGTVFEVFNAGTSTTQGVEIENTYAVTDNLTLNGALTWLETADFGDDVDPGLAVGRRRGQAPEIAYVIGGTYDRPLTGDVDFYVNANYAFNGEMFLADDGNQPLASLEQDGYGVFGASIGLRSVGSWDINAFCRNCFEEEYFTYAFNQPFVPTGSPMVNPADPRVYGVSLKKEF